MHGRKYVDKEMKIEYWEKEGRVRGSHEAARGDRHEPSTRTLLVDHKTHAKI